MFLPFDRENLNQKIRKSTVLGMASKAALSDISGRSRLDNKEVSISKRTYRTHSSNTKSKTYQAAVSNIDNRSRFSLSCNLGINEISFSPNKDRFVAAGRDLLRLYESRDTSFSETFNLRPGRSKLAYTGNSVEWNPSHNFSNLIVTASTNGNCVVWNLTNNTKKVSILKGHSRAANCISWKESEPTQFISGSQDKTVRLWDIRDMACKLIISPKSESVRDAKFNPHSPFIIAIGFENGSLRTFDLRQPKTHLRKVVAHSGIVRSIEWHPTIKNRIATGGRDRMVMIWDYDSKGGSLFSNYKAVQTISGITKVRWNPENPNLIASTASILDSNVYVWDVENHAIPHRTISSPSGSVINDVAWVPNGFANCQRGSWLVTAAKNGTLSLVNIYTHGINPMDRIRGSSLFWSNDNKLTWVRENSKEKLKKESKSKNKPSQPNQQSPSSFMSFMKSSSNISKNNKISSIISMFLVVDSSLKEEFLSQDEFKFLAENLVFLQPNKESNRIKGFEYSKNLDDSEDLNLNKMRTRSDVCRKNSQVCAEINLLQHAQYWEILAMLLEQEELIVIKEEPKEKETSEIYKPKDKASIIELDEDTNSNENENTISNDTGLYLMERDFIDSPSIDDDSSFYYDAENNEYTDKLIEPGELPGVEKIEKKETNLNGWNWKGIIVDALLSYGDLGDVQTCVATLFALGEGDINLGPDLMQLWIHSYIEQLQRVSLFTCAAEIIKGTSWMDIKNLSTDSTRFGSKCNECDKELSECGWFCKNCNNLTSTCSFCHLPVKGVYLWCQGCGHGGHLEHMESWFGKHRRCPTGCGHRCVSSHLKRINNKK